MDHKNLGYKETLKRLAMYYGSGNMSDICNGDTQKFIKDQQKQIESLKCCGNCVITNNYQNISCCCCVHHHSYSSKDVMVEREWSDNWKLREPSK